MSEKKEIPVAVRKMAEIIKPHVVVKGDVAILPDDIYEKTLGNEGDPTMDEVKRVHGHRNTFNAGFQLAVGERTIDAMKDDADIVAVTGRANIHEDRADVLVRRDFTFRSKPTDPNSDRVTVHGQTTGGYTSATSGNGKTVRQHLREYAASAFAS